jgi:DNA segregation ATPase FtsK/SpoIIIE-like protein
MSDLFTDWDWNQVLNSTEKWEEDNLVGEELNHASIDTSDEGREKDDIVIDDIQQLILTLENNDIRTAERQLLDAIKPHYYTATSDIWDNFYLRIPILNEEKDFQKEKEAVPKPQTYEIQSYSVPRPVFEEIEKRVAKEAVAAVKTPKFWKLRTLRDDYVGEHTYPSYKEAVKQWEEEKEAFEKQEIANQEEFNKKEQNRYDEAIREIEEREQSYLHPNPSGIQKQIQKDLSEVSLPYAVSAAFALSNGNVFVDILYSDRYEIIPSEFISRTKTQTEENLRYIEILLSCAYIIAATVFNASHAIKSVTVVGHTHAYSTNEVTITDSSIYAVTFDRLSFARDFTARRYFSPYERLTHYLHLLDVSKRYIISPIKIKGYKDLVDNELNELRFSAIPIPPDETINSDEFKPKIKLDDRFEEAAKLVVATQRASASELQRRLGMGYAKTGYVLDQLETAGIVGPQEGSRPREVYVSDLRELDGIIRSLKQ